MGGSLAGALIRKRAGFGLPGGAGSETFTAVKDNAEIAPLIAKVAGY